MTEVAELGERLQARRGAQQELRRQLEEAVTEAERNRTQAQLLDNVVALLAAMQEVWREGFQKGVGAVVSRGLAGVFDEPLELAVEMGRSGDLPVAKFLVRDGRGLETDVMESRGGGLVSVASFLLRVLLLLSARPPLGRLLVLDETFANLSQEYLSALVALLRRICDEGGFQILLVTHRPELADAADVAYRFRLDADGVTQVERLRSAGERIAEGGG